MSADERAAVDRALVQIKRMNRGSVRMLEILGDLLAARGRAARRAASDRVTDGRRRITISSRVNRDIYERILSCKGERSLYRFILDAVLAECARVEGITER